MSPCPEGRKFFPKNFFAPRGELGREEVQGILVTGNWFSFEFGSRSTQKTAPE